MAVTILKDNAIPAPELKFGLVAQLGINISRFTVRYYPEVNTSVPNLVGNTLWRIVSEKLSREVTCEGEIMTASGVMAFTLATALTFANTLTHFTGTAGTFYLDEAVVTSERRGWARVSIKASTRASL